MAPSIGALEDFIRRATLPILQKCLSAYGFYPRNPAFLGLPGHIVCSLQSDSHSVCHLTLHTYLHTNVPHPARSV